MDGAEDDDQEMQGLCGKNFLMDFGWGVEVSWILIVWDSSVMENTAGSNTQEAGKMVVTATEMLASMEDVGLILSTHQFLDDIFGHFHWDVLDEILGAFFLEIWPFPFRFEANLAYLLAGQDVSHESRSL